MTVPAADWSTKLVEHNVRTTRVIGIIEAARRGLDEAKAGIQRVRFTDDGHDDNDLAGPGVLPRPDEARRAKSALSHALAMSDIYMRRAELIAVEYRRLGLPADHPDRRATPEERKSVEDESIDDEDSCMSCARGGGVNPRIGGMKVCGWCAGILRTYGPVPEGKEWGDGPRWLQMTVLPVELVHDHLDAQQGRGKVTVATIEQRLKLGLGPPSRRKDAMTSSP